MKEEEFFFRDPCSKMLKGGDMLSRICFKTVQWVRVCGLGVGVRFGVWMKQERPGFDGNYTWVMVIEKLKSCF